MDHGKDAVCRRDGALWIMAVYFPRGQQDFRVIRSKFQDDFSGVAANQASGIAFVTNQELRLAERKELHSLAGPQSVELYHLERITAILDAPVMAQVRKQFLGIDSSESVLIQSKKLEAGSKLWAAVVALRKTTPPALGVLDWVSYEEEKTLNRNRKIRVLLDALRHDELERWGDVLDPVENDRHILGESLWLLAYVVRAVFGRIGVILIRERQSRIMMPWRDDGGIHQLLSHVCTQEEIAELRSQPTGAVHWLRNHLEAKVLEGIRVLQREP